MDRKTFLSKLSKTTGAFAVVTKNYQQEWSTIKKDVSQKSFVFSNYPLDLLFKDTGSLSMKPCVPCCETKHVLAEKATSFSPCCVLSMHNHM